MISVVPEAWVRLAKVGPDRQDMRRYDDEGLAGCGKTASFTGFSAELG
jgi:hypothetical protein